MNQSEISLHEETNHRRGRDKHRGRGKGRTNSYDDEDESSSDSDGGDHRRRGKGKQSKKKRDQNKSKHTNERNNGQNSSHGKSNRHNKDTNDSNERSSNSNNKGESKSPEAKARRQAKYQAASELIESFLDDKGDAKENHRGIETLIEWLTDIIAACKNNGEAVGAIRDFQKYSGRQLDHSDYEAHAECAITKVFGVFQNDGQHEKEHSMLINNQQIIRTFLCDMLGAMRLFDNLNIQVYGCSLIWQICTSESMEQTLTEAGAIDAVITSMETYPDTTSIQGNGAGALHNLCISAANKVRVAKSRGISVILSGMKNFETNPLVLRQMMKTLAVLALDDTGKRLIGKEGGIGVLLHCLQLHRSHPQVALEGCAAIRNLIINNPRNRKKITSASSSSSAKNDGEEKPNGMSIVVSIMSIHKSKPDVLHSACSAVRNLMANNDNMKKRFEAEEGIPLLLACMKDKSMEHFLMLQRETLGALRNLSAHASAKEYLVKEGCIKTVIHLMKHHMNSPELQEQACVVLFNLCNAKGAATQIVVEGGVSQAISVLGQFIKGTKSHGGVGARTLHPGLIEESCGLLWKIARSEAKQEAYARGGAGIMDQILSLVGRAIDRYRDVPGIQKYANGMRRAWVRLDQSYNPSKQRTFKSKEERRK